MRVLRHRRTPAALTALLLIAAACGLRADSIYVAGRRYVSVQEAAARYGMAVVSNASGTTLIGRSGRVVLYPDKRQAHINYVPFSLGFAPIKRGRLYVNWKDVLNTLDPLLNPACAPRHRIYTVVIDPGHGGKDNGSIGKLYREKNITLRLSRKIGESLRECGYNVLYTRNSDRYLTLSQRSSFANSRDAQLFLSVHVNAAGDHAVTGIETYAIAPQGTPSTSSEKPDFKQYIGNRYDLCNILLAACIHKKMILASKAKDRGVKRARFQVLRNTDCPAVLLEIGFISNSAEERRIGSESYLDTLANAVAAGVLQYHRTIAKKQR